MKATVFYLLLCLFSEHVEFSGMALFGAIIFDMVF